MSMYYRKHGEFEEIVFGPSMTKQAFKDETDVNRIIAKFQVSGVISHQAKYGGVYGDFSDFDFLQAQNDIRRAEVIFAALPSEVRREFDQDMSKFFSYVNDPENIGKLDTLLPKIAEPGSYNLDVSDKSPPGELVSGGEPGPPAEPVGETP